MGRPAADASRDTRRAILDAAVELMAEHGYAGTSMRALGRALGLRESAVYHYFPSKEALFEALFEDLAAQREGELTEELTAARARSLEEVLTSLTERFVVRLESEHQRKLWRIVTTEGRRLGDGHAWRTLLDRPRKVMMQLFEELIARGLVRDDVSIEVLVMHVIAPIIVVLNAPMGGGKGPLAMSKARFVKEHVAFLVEALAPGARRRSR